MVKRPPLYYVLYELRLFLEFGLNILHYPFLKNLPKGDKHPVLILPGFMAHDILTTPLRLNLKSLNYKPYGWGRGVNTGYTNELADDLFKYIQKIYNENDQRSISVIGWSLGGLYARFIAHAMPEMLRCIMTLGSPFLYSLTGTTVGWTYNFISKMPKEKVYNEEMKELLEASPPVPTTNIYSETDGIVNPLCCIGVDSSTQENICVPSTHVGLVWNPFVNYIIADRLSQPEYCWSKFNKKDKPWKRKIYK